jgi:anti-anti-sigma regulatory factor
MTLKIERASDGRVAVLQLVGRMASEHVDEVRAHMRGTAVLDLDEVTLVDAAVVRFLVACEADGVELRNCPQYVREWIGRERNPQA